MSNTYIWKVFNLERTLEDHRVFKVHYTVTAVSTQTDSEGNPYSIRAGGEADLTGEVSVPFADLTEDVVIGWVKASIGGEEKVTEIQTELDNALSEKIQPSISTGIPW
jgi:hypothetical protein